MLKDMIFVLNLNPTNLRFKENWSFNTKKGLKEIREGGVVRAFSSV